MGKKAFIPITTSKLNLTSDIVWSFLFAMHYPKEYNCMISFKPHKVGLHHYPENRDPKCHNPDYGNWEKSKISKI